MIGSTVYIAGPMRGRPVMNFPQFFYWQVVLEKDYKVINPAKEDCIRWFRDGWVFTEDQYDDVLDYDCALIREKADWVFVLKGWNKSVGAKREIVTAHEAGIPVYYEDKCFTKNEGWLRHDIEASRFESFTEVREDS